MLLRDELPVNAKLDMIERLAGQQDRFGPGLPAVSKDIDEIAGDNPALRVDHLHSGIKITLAPSLFNGRRPDNKWVAGRSASQQLRNFARSSHDPSCSRILLALACDESAPDVDSCCRGWILNRGDLDTPPRHRPVQVHIDGHAFVNYQKSIPLQLDVLLHCHVPQVDLTGLYHRAATCKVHYD